MSHYISVVITIGIPRDFSWLDDFIEGIYRHGEVYTSKSNKCLDAPVLLPRNEARVYFEAYMKQLQASVNFSDGPPSIMWGKDPFYYDIRMYARPGYIEWSIDLLSHKVYKDAEQSDTDFEYYFRLLMKTMHNFPILELRTEDDGICDFEWLQVEGKWWRFKIQEPAPLQNFQMVDIIILKAFSVNLIQDLIIKASQNGLALLPPAGASARRDSLSTEMKSSLLFSYAGKDVSYQLQIAGLEQKAFTRLLFRTPLTAHPAPLEQLVDHALQLTSEYVLSKVATFDTRYNYLDTETLL